MPADVRLRPFRLEDAVRMDAEPVLPGDIDFFGWSASNARVRRFGDDGLLGVDHGVLAIEADGVGLVGELGWTAVRHGPPPHGDALNVGIALLAEHRGHGYGTAAQRLLAEYLFASTRHERLEASTDITNIAEQKALVKAGFTREGVLRHSQWRAGAFHDTVLFSRLRGD
jgi:RimJ/RimL family protein N-acetyltransferase